MSQRLTSGEEQRSLSVVLRFLEQGHCRGHVSESAQRLRKQNAKTDESGRFEIDISDDIQSSRGCAARSLRIPDIEPAVAEDAERQSRGDRMERVRRHRNRF